MIYPRKSIFLEMDFLLDDYLPTINYDGWYFLHKIRNRTENIAYRRNTIGGNVYMSNKKNLNLDDLEYIS